MKAQIDTLDCVSTPQVGHPKLRFSLSKRTVDLAPVGLDRVFPINSGSEAYDTATKVALAQSPVFEHIKWPTVIKPC